MGWTIYDAGSAPKDRESERAEVICLYTSLVPDAPCTAACLMASKVGATWYLAIRLTPKPGRTFEGHWTRDYVPAPNGSITYAGVILTRRENGEWGYKDMSECVGPADCDAPLKLLDMLSDLTPDHDRYARDWRERVRAHHAARRARLKIEDGDRIEVDTPFRFGGGIEARQFEAFLYTSPSAKRGQLLYRTLDTKCVHYVRLTARQIQAAGARRILDRGDADASAPPEVVAE